MNRALILAAAILLTLAACGNDTEQPRQPGETAQTTELTAFELEHGIGPFTEEVEVGPIDPELAAQGQDIYEMSCEACHQMEGRFVGPPLGDVTERRSPTFIMNMIMNPEEMAQRHPVVQELLAQYPVIMPYQNITEEQSRAILEYLRLANEQR
jgi:mono/diheme cytochrome c family protein